MTRNAYYHLRWHQRIERERAEAGSCISLSLAIPSRVTADWRRTASGKTKSSSSLKARWIWALLSFHWADLKQWRESKTVKLTISELNHNFYWFFNSVVKGGRSKGLRPLLKDWDRAHPIPPCKCPILLLLWCGSRPCVKMWSYVHNSWGVKRSLYHGGSGPITQLQPPMGGFSLYDLAIY